jgi:hypothetical protein
VKARDDIPLLLEGKEAVLKRLEWNLSLLMPLTDGLLVEVALLLNWSDQNLFDRIRF